MTIDKLDTIRLKLDLDVSEKVYLLPCGRLPRANILGLLQVLSRLGFSSEANATGRGINRKVNVKIQWHELERLVPSDTRTDLSYHFLRQSGLRLGMELYKDAMHLKNTLNPPEDSEDGGEGAQFFLEDGATWVSNEHGDVTMTPNRLLLGRMSPNKLASSNTRNAFRTRGQLPQGNTGRNVINEPSAENNEETQGRENENPSIETK